ncbi:hypothetical protein C9374_014390 [Naegleria lovaniensis]|uniref:F-box domain-containing protein n=1 Tax=Naegleria lovaniensis TaxID=51637 RepID=A0AA88KMI7_NAELO|nr:uncharacterized protein C9374_014390 [Naegleria lovaniensis]KAG2388990.1 hypothetical protein C9374_014390 [Naegleria lovaniensis]
MSNQNFPQNNNKTTRSNTSTKRSASPHSMDHDDQFQRCQSHEFESSSKKVKIFSTKINMNNLSSIIHESSLLQPMNITFESMPPAGKNMWDLLSFDMFLEIFKFFHDKNQFFNFSLVCKDWRIIANEYLKMRFSNNVMNVNIQNVTHVLDQQLIPIANGRYFFKERKFRVSRVDLSLVTRLNIVKCKLEEAHFHALARSLPNLSALCIYSCPMKYENLEIMFPVENGPLSLNTLILSHVDLNNDGAKLIAHRLENGYFPSLTYLSLNGHKFKKQGMNALLNVEIPSNLKLFDLRKSEKSGNSAFILNGELFSYVSSKHDRLNSSDLDLNEMFHEQAQMELIAQHLTKDHFSKITHALEQIPRISLGIQLAFHLLCLQEFSKDEINQMNEVRYCIGEMYETKLEGNESVMKKAHLQAKECLVRMMGYGTNTLSHFEKKEQHVSSYWYLKASTTHGMAQLKVGLACEKYCYYHRAFEMYQKAFKQGNVVAWFNLARCYEKGYGVDQDNYMALDMYKSLAEKENDLDAIVAVSELEKNVVEKFKWQEKAAAMGHCKSMLEVGKRYCMGQVGVVQQNISKGVRILQRIKSMTTDESTHERVDELLCKYSDNLKTMQ